MCARVCVCVCVFVCMCVCVRCVEGQIALPSIHTQTELVGRKGQAQPQPQVMEHYDVDTISPVAKNLYQFVPFIFEHQLSLDREMSALWISFSVSKGIRWPKITLACFK